MNDNFLYKELTYEIINAALAVHNELGPGFPECIYQEAFELELSLKRIAFEKQKVIKVFYKGKMLKHNYFLDLLIDDKVIVEIKTVSTLVKEHSSQCLTYLKATNKKVALLFNFASTSLQHKRIIL